MLFLQRCKFPAQGPVGVLVHDRNGAAVGLIDHGMGVGFQTRGDQIQRLPAQFQSAVRSPGRFRLSGGSDACHGGTVLQREFETVDPVFRVATALRLGSQQACY